MASTQPQPIPLAACLMFGLLAGFSVGCSSRGTGDLAQDRTISQATPPDDFWLSATVLGPVRTASATSALARAQRPGRYVVEPDRGLRVSLGTGAQETTFPPLTRTLTRAEFTELWSLANAAGLLDASHPGNTTGNGTVDPETIQGKTVYVLTTHASGRRALVILETDPECDDWCGKAKRVVDWMSAKAWMKEADAKPPQ